MPGSSARIYARWCAAFAAVVVSAAGAVAAVGYGVDAYGLFRDPHGRRIAFHSNDGTSKYLLSQRYIPANFDAIMVGSSISASWDVSGIDAARVYNASVNGGNISDEKVIVQNVLSRGRVKLVIFCIHPYLTASHGQHTGDMTRGAYWGALGSMQLAKELGASLRARVRGGEALGDLTGREPYEPEPDVVKRLQAGPMAGKAIVVDEVAFEEYRQLVQSARAHGARVIAFIPPIYDDFYQARRAEYDAYFARMRALFRPDEKIVDFNEPKYDSWRRERWTFYDGSHLNLKAAGFFSAELAAAIRAYCERGGRLPL